MRIEESKGKISRTSHLEPFRNNDEQDIKDSSDNSFTRRYSDLRLREKGGSHPPRGPGAGSGPGAERHPDRTGFPDHLECALKRRRGKTLEGSFRFSAVPP